MRCLLLLASLANGLKLNRFGLKLDRRAFAVGLAGLPAVASASQFSTATAIFNAGDPNKSPFQGYFIDPNHLKGYRIIKADVERGTLTVTGRDGPDDTEFVLSGVIQSQFNAVLDFSSKGGPSNVSARFKLLQGRPIVEFPDGNGWARISDKPEIPKPKDIARERPMSADKRSGFAKVMDAIKNGEAEPVAAPAPSGFSLPSIKLPFS